MNIPKNNKELLRKLPELKDLADQATDGRGLHFCQLKINGEWENTTYEPTAVAEVFYANVIRAFQRFATHIKIRLLKDVTKKTPYIKEVVLELEPKAALGTVDASVKDKLDVIEKTLAEKTTNSDALVQLQMQIKDIQHTSEIEKLKIAHEKDLQARDKQIESLQEEIAELEEELKESDAELGSLEKDSKSKIGNWGEILGAAAENLVRRNPKILTEGFGVPMDVVKKVFAQDGKELNAGAAGSNTSEPTPAADEYEGINADQADAIKLFVAATKVVPFDDFKKLWAVVKMMFTEDGAFQPDKAAAILNAIKNYNPEPETVTP